MPVSQRIDRALIERQVIALFARLVTCNETKAVNVLRQLFKVELQRRKIAINIDQPNARKVADDDVARQLVVDQAMEVVVALGKGRLQVFTACFCSTSSVPGQNTSMRPALFPSFLTFFSKLKTRRFGSPKT